MSLSYYQGTTLNVKIAHRKYDDTTLSRREKELLMFKYKGNKKALEAIEKRCALPENFGKGTKSDTTKFVKTKNVFYSNNIEHKVWSSVQVKTNQISMQCLQSAKNFEM